MRLVHFLRRIYSKHALDLPSSELTLLTLSWVELQDRIREVPNLGNVRPEYMSAHSFEGKATLLAAK